jgi:hypothetical protein
MPGPHGFAVRFSAVRLARREPLTSLPRPASTFRADAAASTTSRLAFVTIAIRPSCRDGTAEKKPLIWEGRKAEYFCAGGWMTQIGLKLFNKTPFARNDTGSLSEGGACPETKSTPR